MLDLREPFVIAEAGTCHAGETMLARYRRAVEYVDAAADCGADAIKFQMFVCPAHVGMFCWIDGDEARAPRWEASAMCWDDWVRLQEHAEKRGLVFLASAFQYITVRWLMRMRVRAFKVASRAAANFPYAEARGPFLISTGMPPYPTDMGMLLECESKYPSDRPWLERYPGFSAHSPAPFLAIDAIERGCRLVEVHFYTDPAHAGPDLPASLDLGGLRAVCAAARQHERKAA